MSEISTFVTIAIIIGALVGGFAAYRKVKSLNMGFPSNDEMKIRIQERSASVAFAFSFLTWCIIVTCINANYFQVQPALNFGILSMPVYYYLARLYFHYIGIKDEK